MRSILRSPLARLVVVLVVLAIVREVSIRYHEADVEDWPRSPA